MRRHFAALPRLLLRAQRPFFSAKPKAQAHLPKSQPQNPSNSPKELSSAGPATAPDADPAPSAPQRPAEKRVKLPENCTTDKLFAFLQPDCDPLRLEIARSRLAPKGTVASLADVYLAGLFCGVKFFEKPQPEPRKPVVSVMGHVDHGKTTLLDHYRRSAVAQGEAGGITQKIGGFTHRTPCGDIAFLDTPGHEVFENMRRTGALAADVAVLLVSAVEGVQAQTREVLDTARRLRLPLVVAVNKVDAPLANVHAVEEQLVDCGVELAPYGGSVDVVHISARSGLNADVLAELLCEFGRELRLESDLAPGCAPECLVIEARGGESERPSSATVIVQHGVLRRGQLLTAGEGWFKAQQLQNHRGEPIERASHADVVELTGFHAFPRPGSRLCGLAGPAEAREWESAHNLLRQRRLAAEAGPAQPKLGVSRHDKRRLRKNAGLIGELMRAQKEKLVAELGRVASRQERQRLAAEVEQLERSIEDYAPTVLAHPIVIKTADQGSLETVQGYLARLGATAFTVVHAGCGAVTAQDVELATEAGAELYTFGLPESPEMFALTRERQLTYVNYALIHQLTQCLERLNAEAAGDDPRLRCVGRARVVRLINVSTRKEEVEIVGVRVTEGALSATGSFRLLRQTATVRGELKALSLRHFKQPVAELEAGKEGGVVLSDQSDVLPNDVLECYA